MKNTILTQKVSISIEIQAHDNDGNIKPIFKQGEQPTNVFQSSLIGPLNSEFFEKALAELTKVKEELTKQLEELEKEELAQRTGEEPKDIVQ